VHSHFNRMGIRSRSRHRPTGTTLVFHFLERFFLLAGIVLFVYLILRLGPHSVIENLRLIGWGFALVIAQEAIAATANTLGWRHAFRQPRAAIPFRQLFAARVAGDGINCVTPTATIGGEFVRARMIEDGSNPTAVWASVAVAKITQTVAQVVFILLGLLFVATHTPLPTAVRDGLLVGVPLLVALVVLTVVLQRRGLFTTGVSLLQRLRLPVPTKVGKQLRRLDDEIQRIYAAPASFLLSTGFFLLGWTCGLIEIYLILHFLQIGASWQRALTIEALSVTVDALFFFVPAKAGTQEAGKVLIFTILDLDPAKGLALGIVRRIRELFWAGIGLLFLSRYQLARRGLGRSRDVDRRREA
jgi:glycosyltransferase 2 family protein